MSTRALLCMARRLVMEAIHKINELKRQLEESILQELRNIVSAIVGTAWRGQGAQKFVDEVNNVVVPRLLSIIGLATSYNKCVNDCVDTIDQAHTQVKLKVDALCEQFDRVYP